MLSVKCTNANANANTNDGPSRNGMRQSRKFSMTTGLDKNSKNGETDASEIPKRAEVPLSSKASKNLEEEFVMEEFESDKEDAYLGGSSNQDEMELSDSQSEPHYDNTEVFPPAFLTKDWEQYLVKVPQDTRSIYLPKTSSLCRRIDCSMASEAIIELYLQYHMYGLFVICPTELWPKSIKAPAPFHSLRCLGFSYPCRQTYGRYIRYARSRGYTGHLKSLSGYKDAKNATGREIFREKPLPLTMWESIVFGKKSKNLPLPLPSIMKFVPELLKTALDIRKMHMGSNRVNKTNMCYVCGHSYSNCSGGCRTVPNCRQCLRFSCRGCPRDKSRLPRFLSHEHDAFPSDLSACLQEAMFSFSRLYSRNWLSYVDKDVKQLVNMKWSADVSSCEEGEEVSSSRLVVDLIHNQLRTALNYCKAEDAKCDESMMVDNITCISCGVAGTGAQTINHRDFCPKLVDIQTLARNNSLESKASMSFISKWEHSDIGRMSQSASRMSESTVHNNLLYIDLMQEVNDQLCTTDPHWKEAAHEKYPHCHLQVYNFLSKAERWELLKHIKYNPQKNLKAQSYADALGYIPRSHNKRMEKLQISPFCGSWNLYGSSSRISLDGHEAADYATLSSMRRYHIIAKYKEIIRYKDMRDSRLDYDQHPHDYGPMVADRITHMPNGRIDNKRRYPPQDDYRHRSHKRYATYMTPLMPPPPVPQ